ncbi:MAG: amidohydrolase family protein [Gemmatimonadetes bacterium]|nr:amidohydrolase family protein [Gemmatimonadota bacterium]
MHRAKSASHKSESPVVVAISAIRSLGGVLMVGAVLMAGCTGPEAGSGAAVTVFEGARLIVGDGSAPIEDAVFVVEGGVFTHAGRRADVQIPEGATHVDLSGKTVMPALVNTHVHLASTRDERADQLQHMAYYGAGLVVSLGLDEGDVPFEMRDEAVPDGARSRTAGRGITAPEVGRTEVPIWITSEAEARTAVQELADREVDLVKIWVDTRGGRFESLSPDLYGAVIDEAHTQGLRAIAHVFTLEDAKGLLRAGIDAFAHGVRDQDVDDELVALWRERPNVVLVPNLPNPGVAGDLSWLSGTVPPDQLQQMQDAQRDRPAAQESFGIQARNLARLNQAGVTVAFGTDGSSPWAVHQEMEDMVRSGMTPAEVIVAATRNSAELMQMTDIGTVAVGKSADFIVLDANPLDDITNTRRIDAVYLRGMAVDRDALGARFIGGTP